MPIFQAKVDCKSLPENLSTSKASAEQLNDFTEWRVTSYIVSSYEAVIKRVQVHNCRDHRQTSGECAVDNALRRNASLQMSTSGSVLGATWMEPDRLNRKRNQLS
ncbi:unnamed protein product [Mesocestoides corti]|uniref:Uncharacterized protein n=1 Tax=Mesocestoides corti TaxID=53468 RepID=A0A0R3UPB2_MESCO|nr:unnamed protein product [Mesocestoides corti]